MLFGATMFCYGAVYAVLLVMYILLFTKSSRKWRIERRNFAFTASSRITCNTYLVVQIDLVLPCVFSKCSNGVSTLC